MPRSLFFSGLLVLAAPLCAAAPIDLGLARDYNAVFFGDLRAHSDIEGRVAVRGDVDVDSISVGYRNPSPAGAQGSSAASLRVGGDIRLGGGAIYNGPLDPGVDHNAGVGPSQAPWLQGGVAAGYAEYAGRDLGSAAYLDVRAGDAAAIGDFFASAKQQLGAVSQQLGALQATGSVLTDGWDMRLSGSVARDGLHVFHLDAQQLKSFTLDSAIGADEWLVINLLAPGRIEFGWDYAGSGLAAIADRLIINVLRADELLLRSGHGLLLAPGADVLAGSSGHWEGQLVADDMLSTIEIGYEPLRQAPLQSVPLPGSLPLLALAGLTALFARRRGAQSSAV
jgi:choice-of-anchor A domain-containing protein